MQEPNVNNECEFCNGRGGFHGDIINADGNIEFGVGAWEKCICQVF